MGLYIVSVLIFIVCILMILIVLAQNSKGGGLTSTFSGGNQVMGVKRTTDFMEKATWTLAVALLVLSLSTVFVIDDNPVVEGTENSELEYIRNNENAQPINFQPTTTDDDATTGKQETTEEEAPALPTE
jgi:preprotein translocase subunit SecG